MRNRGGFVAAMTLVLLVNSASSSSSSSASASVGPASPVEEKDPLPRIEWTFVKGKTIRFRLDYEDSRRLEPLDSSGRPLKSPPDFQETRKISLILQWRWTRQKRSASVAEVVFEKIQVELPTWRPNRAPPKNLRATNHLKHGAVPRVEVLLTNSEKARLLRFTLSVDAAQQFEKLVTEAIGDFLRYLPARDKPISRAGEKWSFRRDFTLMGQRKLRSSVELEYVERPKQGRRPGALARIEGSIRQEVPGAPAHLKRLPGLFPGTVKWVHDLDGGFPRLLQSEKIARIPIADDLLPVIRTLTHTYRLHVGDPRAFPK